MSVVVFSLKFCHRWYLQLTLVQQMWLASFPNPRLMLFFGSADGPSLICESDGERWLSDDSCREARLRRRRVAVTESRCCLLVCWFATLASRRDEAETFLSSSAFLPHAAARWCGFLNPFRVFSGWHVDSEERWLILHHGAVLGSGSHPLVCEYVMNGWMSEWEAVVKSVGVP